MNASDLSSQPPCTPDETSAAPEASAHVAEGRASRARTKRVWALALGTAAVWQIDPALVEMADMVGLIACAGNKSLVGDSIAGLRARAQELRTRIEPLPAGALAKVVRRTEAACGAVMDKGARLKELQTSWDHFVACLRANRTTATDGAVDADVKGNGDSKPQR
ncbi:MAG: hypothetical protein EOO28_02880 [Comamonadaceae bacterium]|nr:MAG: hypothetical protein EOO28_02880 [Comamonadaceae bacterium]